jgi:hypothetical protein
MFFEKNLDFLHIQPISFFYNYICHLEVWDWCGSVSELAVFTRDCFPGFGGFFYLDEEILSHHGTLPTFQILFKYTIFSLLFIFVWTKHDISSFPKNAHCSVLFSFTWAVDDTFFCTSHYFLIKYLAEKLLGGLDDPPGDKKRLRARIFKQSMGARNRGGIGLSYRPARLHRLAEFIHGNRFLDSINV